MGTQTVIPAVTGAVVTQVPIQTDQHAHVFVSADFLAGAEEVDIYYRANNTWVVVADPSTGSPVKLTASIPVVALRGGPLYGVTKDATATACGVYWEPGARVY